MWFKKLFEDKDGLPSSKRVQSFALQVKDGADYKTIHQGTTIGKQCEIKFKPVTTRVVRLLIGKATEGPTIWEFELYPTGK